MDYAEKIFNIYRGRLYKRLPMLALALGSLTFSPEGAAPVGTDGERIYGDGAFLRRDFLENGTQGEELLLHSLLHCLLGHLWRPGWAEPERWELAADMASAFLSHALWPQLPEGPVAHEARLRCPRGCSYSAERIYALLPEGFGYTQQELQEAFHRDDHSRWETEETRQRRLLTGAGDGLSLLWKRLAQGMSWPADKPAMGVGTPSRRQDVQLMERGAHRFADFVRAFAEIRENRHVSGDEFQYAWYLYSLEHYDGVAIVEPLEYSEERRLYELAVVIDTSASCSRSLTARFLEELRGILCREKLFFERFNLHIIQCDCQVQQDVKLCTLSEFEDYIDHLEIYGGGGTDFRPAFRHVDRLVEEGELAHLKGLLYFTDGYGVYPERAPGYEAAFVMLQHRYDDIDLPPWALKLILEAQLPQGDEAWI